VESKSDFEENMSQQIIHPGGSDRAKLVKRGQYLEYFTIGYNSLEGLIAILAGLLAGSIALAGFGFDSVIEVTSGLALLWRLHAGTDEVRRERIEAITLRIVGASMQLMEVYLSSFPSSGVG
jgi:divalent metal cation (Fe/Co/Zn/Cd) transporter